LPVLAAEIPRSGGPASRALGRLILALLDWRVEGDMPNLRKFVIIVAPHTSNWDFAVGMGAKLALGLQASWVGKHTIFRGPIGTLLKSLGGIPVDRSAANEIVQQLVGEFARRERMVFALAPEGTRKKVERWKTGFYHIARGAAVPIVPVALDFGARLVRIMPPFETTGDVDADVRALRELFVEVRGRNR
jgi:1-acyl-sn-glycerol-3-phosphate acyltransferase